MVRVAVVVVDDLLELELLETYPDGDDGDGVFLLDEEFDRLRSIVRKMSPTVSGYGVGGRSLTGLKVCSMYFCRNSYKSCRFSIDSFMSRIWSCCLFRMSAKFSKSL